MVPTNPAQKYGLLFKQFVKFSSICDFLSIAKTVVVRKILSQIKLINIINASKEKLLFNGRHFLIKTFPMSE